MDNGTVREMPGLHLPPQVFARALVELERGALQGFRERIELAGLTVEAISKDEVWSKLDLTLYSRERADRIRLDLVYNADLFARARMFEMTEQLKSLFAQIVENPDKKIDRYSLVTSNSEALLPCPTRPLFSRWEGSLCRRFSEQAGKASEAGAVVVTGIGKAPPSARSSSAMAIA